jgi:hypothetical protein
MHISALIRANMAFTQDKICTHGKPADLQYALPIGTIAAYGKARCQGWDDLGGWERAVARRATFLSCLS